MNDILELNRRATRFCWTLFEAQAHAWTVIGFRMPGLALSAGQVGAPSAESRMMVDEKVLAAQQGLAAGSRAAASLGAAAGLGPIAFASAMLGVMEATAGPGHRKVRSNARRLSKKASRGG
ncbi:MAG: hypothetical protein K2X62_00750 [Beijerinckiaceae bacterium]|nr:hypothetical protein [Beijerinckiaceae bacterium]MDO9441984.1 hypothetical protein [Beijerinckiaceae bacterium]